jgi:hypothetical protein
VNRYYIAAKHISNAIARGDNSDYTQANIGDTIERAKTQIQNGEMECVAIVKIVAVVRRQKTPVTVEYIED